MALLTEISRKLPLFTQDSTAPTHTLGTPRLLLRHNKLNPVHTTTEHKDTPPIWMDRTLRLYGFIKEISQKLPLFSQDSSAPTHTLETPRLLLRHNKLNPVHLTTGHKNTPPIWMASTLRLYGFIINSRKTTLITKSTAHTHTLGTPRLLLRHNELNPVRSTIGYEDTPPIWMDRTLRLYGFKKFLGNYHSFHRAPPPPHTFSGLLNFY